MGSTDFADLLTFAHAEQYVGTWACEERAFHELLARVQTRELLEAHIRSQLLEAHMRSQSGAPVGKPGEYRVADGIAVIGMVGPMTKYGSSLSASMPFGTVGVRKAMRSAAADPAVDGIFLFIDSPGGMTAGTSDLAEEVTRARAKKPVVAYIEDMGASAAYWVASQADRVVANRGAVVGSIGTYLVVQDLSGLYASAGVRTHVVRAGAFKGTGVEGAPVTSEQLVELQRTVDSINSVFLKGVASGRRMDMEKVKALADGRVHVGEEAKALGLVDAIEDYQMALGSLVEKRKRRTLYGGAAMAEQAPAASYDDIVTLCPGADEKFICGQLARKSTADQARSNWADEQNKRIAQLKEKVEAESKARAEVEAKVATKKPGFQPLGDGSKAREASGDPATEWREAIEAKVKAGVPRGRAACMVARERPELREALVAAANLGRKTA